MKFLLACLLLTFSLSAYADASYILVGYICDKKEDRLTLTYDGASDNEAGEKMMANKSKTQWNSWQLTIAKDENHIGSLITVKRKCHLSDGTYDIAIFPKPGNFNVQGRCGAWMSAGATIKKKGEIIYTISGFERDCMDMETPVITRVIVKPGNKNPDISKIEAKEFYK